MTAWKQLAKAHELHMPEFSFANGERRYVKLHCRTLGQLNSARNNAVLLLHGTTGSSMQFFQPDMANFLFDRDQPLDHNEYFLIMPDAIGHGESSKPSSADGPDFPQYSYMDIVRAQHAVVRELFNIDHLRLILGTSMGGMNTWIWGIAYPTMMDALMPIACLPYRLSGHNLLFRRLMLALIQSDPKYTGNDLVSTSYGLGMAWNLFQLMIGGQAEFARQFRNVDMADQHIRETAENAESSQQYWDVVWEFKASQDYDPVEDLEKVQASLLTLNFTDDQINGIGFTGLEQDIQRVRRGRSVIIDAGEEASGHRTLSKAKVWHKYVGGLLADSAL